MTAEQSLLKNERGEVVGVPNRELLTGKLSEEYEAEFMRMLDEINDYYPGELLLQAKGESGEGKITRSLNELDEELSRRPDIDVVVIDPIYGFSDVYGRNNNRTTGGAAEQSARRFEGLVGDHNVVGIYAVQADVDRKEKGEDVGSHELRIPSRDKVKTTKALLEIATILFGFDSNNDGLAALGIEKGRDGGEDFELELISMLDVGVLREPVISPTQFI
jgi:replicative DNA helicase